MKRIKLMLPVLIAIVFMSTGSMAQHNDHTGHPSAKGKTDQPAMTGIDKEFQAQLTDLYDKTLSLNEAFVQTDRDMVVMEANKVEKALQAINMKLLEGDAHAKWMQEMKIMNNSLSRIKNAEEIEQQRHHFAAFNESLYRSIKSFGLAGEDVFYQYCPMAFDNQGAYWLNDTKEIRNPYFGDKMLTCGSVREVLEF